MTTALLPTAPVITVDGADLTASWLSQLTGLRVERGFGLVGRLTLSFADAGYALSTTSTFTLGTSVTVALSGGKGTLITATVTGVSLEQSANEQPELVVVAHDAGHKLTRATRVRTFLDMSYSDVLQQVISGSGLAADVSPPSSDVPEYLLQAGTDVAFLDAVTRRVGYVWWVDAGKVMVRQPSMSGEPAVRLKMTESMYEFAVRATGLRPDTVSATGWDPAVGNDLVGNATTASAAPDATFVGPYQRPGTLGSATIGAGDRNPATPSEATTFAKALYDDWAASSVEARGTCLVDAALAPGVIVAVEQAGPASGKYLVSSVEHVYGRAGFHSRFVAGPNRPAGLVDTLGAPSGDGGLTLSGVVAGVVTDNNDPDKVGRVKVKYVGIDGTAVSPWSRVVTLGAGSERGVVFQPEVDDEVLVAFERGDPRRPIVLGGLYSKKHTMAQWGVKDSKVASRRITSRTGHILEFSDGDGSTDSYLLMQLGTAAHKVRLGKDRFDVEVAEGIPVLVKAGSAKFEITAQGDVAIEGNNVSIKAKQQLQLESLVKASLKGTAETAVQGAKVGVVADGMASVEASGPLTLKGAMVAIN